VASVCFSNDEAGPAAAVGLSAHAHTTKALDASLLEALFMMTNLRRQYALGKQLPAKAGFDDIHDMLDHGLLYARHSMRPHLDEFVAGGQAPSPDSSAIEGLLPLAVALRDMGHEPLAVDLTTEDLEDIGVKVVRICVPGLEPLDSSHRRRHLGGARLQSVPQTLGLRDRPQPEDEFNPIPHPFA
jgi:ribosomal protein S12 methylthiotransferase accessory factor